MEVIIAHLGKAIKSARLAARLTQEELSERIGVSTRYVTGLENEKKQPSFKVLCKLMHTLNIPAAGVFYPEQAYADNESAELIRLLSQCGTRDIAVLTDTAKSLLKNK